MCTVGIMVQMSPLEYVLLPQMTDPPLEDERGGEHGQLVDSTNASGFPARRLYEGLGSVKQRSASILRGRRLVDGPFEASIPAELMKAPTQADCDRYTVRREALVSGYSIPNELFRCAFANSA